MSIAASAPAPNSLLRRTQPTGLARRRGRVPACLLLAILLLHASGFAAAARWSQLTQLGFQHLGTDQGLPNIIATALAEDGQGFLWVGTPGGLARWDGYRFRAFRASPGTEGALTDNMIQALHGDRDGRLWIGTSAAGLVRYDAAADRFVAYGAGPQGLSHVSVRGIVDDGAGGLWVATDGGLDHVDAGRGTIRSLRAMASDGAGLPPGPVRALLRDQRGRLWVGTPVGLFRRDAPGARFVAVSLPATADGAPPAPQCLLEDSASRLWIGTFSGAYVIESDAAAPVPVRETDAFAPGPALQDQAVTDLLEPRPGEIWIATRSQGLVAVDGATRSTHRIRHYNSLPASLAANTVSALYRDRSGLVWVASDGGLSRHDPRLTGVLTMYGSPRQAGPARPDPSGDDSTEISWVLARPDGRIWLGTHKNGIDIIDPSGSLVGALRPDAVHPETALPHDAVLAIGAAGDGNVYVGTKRGLYRARGDGSAVQRVAMAGRAPASNTWGLYAEGDTLWIGGGVDGVWRLDLRSGAAAPLTPALARGLSDQRILTMARDAQGALWIGTRNGLNCIDAAQREVHAYLPAAGSDRAPAGAFVASLHTDRRARLWVGTYGGGISVLEQGGCSAASPPRFRHLGQDQGLPDEYINAVLEDHGGAIWVSTDSGLAVIDPATFAVRSLRRAEGVAFPTYWTGSAAVTDEGELLFGGAGGLTIVQPERLQAWSYRPPVVVTELRVGGRRVPAPTPGAAQAVTVPALANSLAVEFAALDYSAPERNRYAYRLAGYEAEWTETDAGHRVASWSNLPPGDYRLLLRGSNRDGQWSAAPLELALQVQPAWHQSLWFRALMGAALLLAVVVLVQGRTRYLRRQQRVLERRVGERTAALERVQRELQDKSRVLELSSLSDPLTGLRNRRFLTEHVDGLLAASQRRADELALGGGPVSRSAPVDTDQVFLLIDVDHFKAVNDGHGHAAGDAVLVQFARRVQSALRDSDILVRWGGEEFLAVARDTDRRRAEAVAERVRAAVAEAPFVLEGGASLRLSCSIGFACVPFVEHEPRALGWSDVIRLADIGLFTAKRVGRDAWVGLHATPVTRTAGLPARLQAVPAELVQEGEIRLSSNRDADAVRRALMPAAPRGADLRAPAAGS